LGAGGASTGGATSSTDGGRTVVEKLRERLDKLSLEAGIPTGASPVGAPGKWLPGRPCPLDAGRCAERLQIEGVELAFPFWPLPPQLQVAERVVHACTNGGIALLDAPTGTGKSIALLTAAIAWQRKAFQEHGSAPQIIYGVRTHAQLAQMVGELKKMPYRPRMAVIGSREQLCINSEVKASASRQRVSLNLMCRQAARRATHQGPPSARGGFGASDGCACEPYAQLGGLGHARRVFEGCAAPGKLWDVEDLVQVSASSGSLGGCPYYTSHVLAGSADVVICPHNYILDPAVSQCKSHHREHWSLKDRIVIIDEAHNLEQGCRDAGSVEASLSELRQAAAALAALAARHPSLRVRTRGVELSCLDLVTELQRLPMQLATALEALAAGAPSAGRAQGQGPGGAGGIGELLEGVDKVWGLPGHPAAGEFLGHAGLSAKDILSKGTEDLLVELTDRLLRVQATGQESAIATSSSTSGSSSAAQATQGPAAVAEDAALLGVLGRLQELVTKLRLAALHPDAYVLGVKAGGATGPSFAAWLMSPGVIFDTFATQARTVVLASGTLAPMAALSSELAPSTAYVARAQAMGPLEAAHVVAPAQVLVATLARFPGSGRTLIGTYDSWKRADFLEELGNTVAGLVQAIPGGVLCFFPSYAVLEGCEKAWRAASPSGQPPIWAAFQQSKGAVVVEPRGSADLPRTRAAFVNAVRAGRGALCLAVYRGKMSEGLSFDDDLCRGVLCLGVPYPQTRDPIVVAKRRWNDAARSRGARRMLTGEHWYELQAFRAVNQALGRCIRHRFDHGALVLLDARWASQGERSRGLRRHLARWLQPLVEEWPPVATQESPSAAAAGGAATTAWGGIGARLCDFFGRAPQVAEAMRAQEEGAGGARGVERETQAPPQLPAGASVLTRELLAAVAPAPMARRDIAGGLGLRWGVAPPAVSTAAAREAGPNTAPKRLRVGGDSQSSAGEPMLPFQATPSQATLAPGSHQPLQRLPPQHWRAFAFAGDSHSSGSGGAGGCGGGRGVGGGSGVVGVAHDVVWLEAALQGERARASALEEELRRREMMCAEMAAKLAALRGQGGSPSAFAATAVAAAAAAAPTPARAGWRG